MTPPVSTDRPLVFAVLYGPWALLSAGIGLVIAGVVLHRADAVSVAAITLGAACAVTGAILPRASGGFSGAGVTGTLQSVSQVLGLARAHAEASIPEDDPDRAEKVARVVGHAYDLLVAGAGQEGLVIAHTSGARSFTLTGRRDGELATATIDVTSLLRQAFEEGTR